MESKFEEFMTTRNDDIDGAAFLLAAVLTTEKSVFSAPDFLDDAEKTAEAIRSGRSCVNEDGVESRIATLNFVITETIDVLKKHDIPVASAADAPYVMWAAWELYEALLHFETRESDFDYDIDDVAIEWDMEFIGDIEEAARDVFEDMSLNPCHPYVDGAEKPCYLSHARDCFCFRCANCPMIEEWHEPEVAKMMTLSTAHISPETRELLDKENASDTLDICVYPKAEYGWFLYLPSADPLSDNIPDDLMRCIRLAKDYECYILCFDRDCEPCDVLDIYDD